MSVHRTSTRANPSIAGSSCTRTLRRPRRTTPTAKATLVSKTNPSGTMATVPATAPRSAACGDENEPSWLTNRRAAVGSSTKVTMTMIRLIPVRSSEFTKVNRRARSLKTCA